MRSRTCRGRGLILLPLLCFAACSPGGGAGEEDSGPRLGEEQALERATQMLETRPPQPDGPEPEPAPASRR